MPNHSNPSIQDNGTIVSLFTGYGGLDMAVNTALGGTMRVAYTSDIEPGPCAIESFHKETDGNPPNLGDITALDMTLLRPVDVIVGGSPCTDISGAGKRAGMMVETRSGLWSYQMDAVHKSRPWMVQWENVAGCLNARATSKADIPVMDERARALKVAGLCGCDEPVFDCPAGFRKPSADSVVPTRMDDALLAWAKKHHIDVSDTICRKCGLPVFEQSQKGLLSGNKRLNGYSTEPIIRALGRVLGDLANLGYDAVGHGLTASEVGAPHRRLRIFVSAWPRTIGTQAPPRNRRLRRLAGLPPMRPIGEPWACWDRTLDAWTVGVSDLFGDTQIFKYRWPKSGIMAQGCVYHIEADSGRQSKSRLLPTPTSNEWNGGTIEPNRRRAMGHAVTVADWAEKSTDISVLPTLTAFDESAERRKKRDHKPGSMHSTNLARTCSEIMDGLFPTPTARDWKGRNQRNTPDCLPVAAELTSFDPTMQYTGSTMGFG